MALKLRKRSFQVVHASIGASFFREFWTKFDSTISPERITWGITIECEEKEFDDELWQPSMSFRRLTIPIKSWHAIAGLTIDLENGIFSVLGDGAVQQAKGRLGKLLPSQVGFECEGRCDVDWDEPFGADVPFSISTILRFSGIRVVGISGDNDQTLEALLREHFDVGDLVSGPCSEGGTPLKSKKKMLEKVFTPSEAA